MSLSQSFESRNRTLLVKFPSDEARIVYVGTGTAAQVLREEIHTPLKTLFEKAKQTKTSAMLRRPRRSTAANVADWDDMERDYHNSTYENPEDPDGAGIAYDYLRLYFSKISTDLTTTGLSNMCAQYGNVTNCFVNTDSRKRYAMVTFETASQANLALTNLNDVPPFYMKVSFSKASKNKKQQPAAERSFSRTTPQSEPRGRWEGSSTSSGQQQNLDMMCEDDLLVSADQVNLDELDDEELQAMLYEMKIQRIMKQRERTRQSRGAVLSGGRFMVDHRVIVRNSTAGGDAEISAMDGDDVTDDITATPPVVPAGQCVLCQSPSAMFCGRCKMTPYCSVRCQQRDWAKRHGKVCHNLAAQAKMPAQIPSSTSLIGDIPSPRVSRPEARETVKPIEALMRNPIAPPPEMINGDIRPGPNIRNMGPAGRPIPSTEMSKQNDSCNGGNQFNRSNLNNNNASGYNRNRGANNRTYDNRNREGHNYQGNNNSSNDQYDKHGNVQQRNNDYSKPGYNKRSNDDSGRPGYKARVPGMRPPLRHDKEDCGKNSTDAAGEVKEVAKWTESNAVESAWAATQAAKLTVKKDTPPAAKDTPEHFAAELTITGDIINVTECRTEGGLLTGLAIGTNHMDKYTLLFAPLEEACTASAEPYVPAPGALFSLQDPTDSAWYRARCLAAGDVGKAALIDAARTLPLKGVTCRALDAKFAEIPEFSCILETQIEVEDGASLVGTVVSKAVNGVVTVSLTSLEVGSELGEGRLSRWRPPVDAPKPAPAPIPDRAVPVAPPERPTATKSPPPHSTAAERTPTKETTPVVKETPEHYLPELAERGSVLSMTDVVCIGEQTMCLVVDATHADQYNRLIEEFGAACGSDTADFVPSPGDILSVLDPSDGFWYRARCLSGGAGGRVALFDVPRFLSMDGVKCRKLAAEYAAMPEFTCIVDGQVKVGESYRATVVSKTVSGELTVSLTALEGDSVLGEARLSRWRPPVDSPKPAATPVTPVTPANTPRTPSATPVTPAAAPEVIVPFIRPALENDSEVLLVHASSVDSVWVRSAESDAQHKYNECLQEVALYGLKAPRLTEPQPVGTVVVAEYTDNCHYRALITRTKHAKNMYLIEYLELGVTETTCLEKLRPCPPQLATAQHPPLVSKVSLSGVSALAPPALQYLHKLLDDEEPLKLTTVNGSASVEGGGEVVLTRVKNRERVNGKVEEMSRPEWKKMEEKGVDVLQSKILTMDNMKYVKLPAGGGELLVLDGSLINAGVISGCSQDEPNMQYVMEQLPEELAKYCESELGKEPYLPRPDELCVAQCPPHEGWFRALMAEQPGGAGGREATIVYVDYGNMSTVGVSLLRKMLPEFVKEPALACLITIKDFPSKPSHATVERAKQLLGMSEDNPYGTLKVTRCQLEATTGMWIVEAPEFIAALRDTA